MPAVYSSPSAPGVVMATGVSASSGSGLEDDRDGACTYLSTDGGVTWYVLTLEVGLCACI